MTIRLFPWRRRSRDRETEIDAEIQAHLELEAAAQHDRGLTPGEADRAARRAFGNVPLIREEVRDMWRWPALDQISQDVRYAIRTMRRTPGVALAAIVSLALGVGVNTAIFSLADALLLRPLAIRDPEAVVAIRSTTAENAFEGVSYADFKDLRERSHVVEGLIAHRLALLAVAKSADALPQMRMGMRVSRDFFQMLGVQPVLGRAFLPEESDIPGRDRVAVLSYQFWVTEFASDPGAIGRTLQISNLAVTIVGVAPQRFTGMDPIIQPFLYVPASLGNPGVVDQRDERGFVVRGRLPGRVTREQAQAEVSMIAASLAEEFPDINRNRGLSLRTEMQLRQEQAPAVFPMVALLMALAALVLTIVCANVANLLMARARARSREIAIRLAIGSGQFRLMRQMLTESVVLALVGGLVAVGLSVLAIQYLSSIRIPTDTPLVIAVRLDTRVLLFSLLAALTSALAFGLAPAWQLRRTDLVTTLKGEDVNPFVRRRLIGRQALVVGQITLSLVLLVAAATMFDAFRKMLVLDPGFRIQHIMMTEFDPTLIDYSPDRTREFYRELVEQARAMPGVRGASLSRAIPFRPNFTEQLFVPEQYELPAGQSGVRISTNTVDEAYFDTMGISLVRGRSFTAADRPETRPTAIVNETFAASYWPNQEGIGKRLRRAGEREWIEVVGVARTTKYLSITEAPAPHVYLPLAQHPQNRLTLLVQTGGDALMIAEPLRRLVQSLDPHMPIFNARTLEAMYRDGALGTQRLVFQLVMVMALLALTLAMVGLYAVVSYSVGRRRREFGVRMSIGARRIDIVRLVLAEGIRLIAIGIVLGLAFSVPLRRLMSAGLAGVGAMGPAALAIAPLALALVALAACLIPAWRASRVSPTSVMRLE